MIEYYLIKLSSISILLLDLSILLYRYFFKFYISNIVSITITSKYKNTISESIISRLKNT